MGLESKSPAKWKKKKGAQKHLPRAGDSSGKAPKHEDLNLNPNTTKKEF
jgi:hypothetical protein